MPVFSPFPPFTPFLRRLCGPAFPGLYARQACGCRTDTNLQLKIFNLPLRHVDLFYHALSHFSMFFCQGKKKIRKNRIIIQSARPSSPTLSMNYFMKSLTFFVNADTIKEYKKHWIILRNRKRGI